MKNKFTGLRVRIKQYTELNLNAPIHGISIEEAGGSSLVIHIPVSVHSDIIFKALAAGDECVLFLVNRSGKVFPCVVESHRLDEEALSLYTELELNHATLSQEESL